MPFCKRKRNQNMTIVIVSRGLPSEQYRTNGIFEYDQAKALAKAGCRVILAGLDLRSVRRKRKWGYQSLEQDGVSVRLLSVPLGNLPKKLFYWAGEKALEALLDRIGQEFGQPDLVHAHFTDLAYLSAKVLKGKKIPLVVTEHSSLINKKEIPEPLRTAAGYAYQNAERVIAVSPGLAENIKGNFGIAPMFLPDMVDTSLFPYRNREKETGFRFVSAGNLLPNKRMDLTIQAFANAFPDREQVTLTIFGGGTERAHLEGQIRELGLENRIFLKGLRPREELSQAFAETDCFVLASRSETFGTVYIEAMSCGVPVIATCCGGPEAYLNESNSIAVDVDDLEGLRDAMLRMYSDPARFDRKAIAQITAEQFSCEAVAERLMGVYEDVLGISPAVPEGAQHEMR